MTHHPNQQIGAESSPTLPRAIAPRPDEHSALPADYTKAQAIQICAKALCAMGLPSSVITAWRMIADTTELSAWHSKHKTPVNFRKLHDLASELGVSDRHWRRIEVQLEQHGLIARATSDNGFRGKAGQGAVTFGLSLEPAIRNFTELLELSKQPEEKERERKLCLGRIRATRKRLKALASFDPLTDAEQATWDRIEGTSRPARLGHAQISALAPYLEQLVMFEEELRARAGANSDEQVGEMPLQTPEQAQAAPCPAPHERNKTAPKMSDAADSHVRLQYNLEYKHKHLNACHEGNQKCEQLASVPKITGEMRDDNATGQPIATIAQKSAQEERANEQHISNSRGTDPANEVNEQDKLQPNSLINVARLVNIHQNTAIFEDIKQTKQGTRCHGLDPQHIWARFRRYNLSKDKQILPIAALRAFIKGWIVDQPQSYLAMECSKGQGARASQSQVNKAHGAGARTNPIRAISTDPQAPATRDQVLDYYAAVFKKGGYIPQTMISPTIMRELAETGRV